MKVRKGFVSNSSSSSFIVGVPTPIRSVEDARKYCRPKFAERLYNMLDTPVFVCNDYSKCHSCEERFFCLTGNSTKFEGMTMEDLKKDFGNMYVYYIVFSDGGDGGDELEGEMRMEGTGVFRNGVKVECLD